MSNTEALNLAIETQDAIRNFVGSHGQENTATFLLLEADRALSAVRTALAQPQPSAPSVEPQGVGTADFEAWWADHGQFCRAGGGDYEKTFAFRAWNAARNIDLRDWSRVHHALAKHGKHPGRTDDHLADVIDRALSGTAPTAQPSEKG